MVRISFPRFLPHSVPPNPVWPPPPPPPPPDHVPFPPLPYAATQAYSFSSSSPLNPVPSKANENAVVRAEDEDGQPGSIASMNPTRTAVLAKRRTGGNFLDYLHVSLRGGTGGDGAIAFEKLFHRRDGRGSPAGAQGGAGGDIYIQADWRVHSLSAIHRNIKGNSGSNGKGDAQKGTKGDDIVIKVPHGTRIRQISREVYRPLSDAEVLLDPIERDPLLVNRLLLCHSTAKLDENNTPPFTPAQKYNTTIHGTPVAAPPPIDLDLRDMGEERVCLVRGGNGGEGNITFGRYDAKTQHLWARRGETPDLVKLELELRLLADIGFLGAPNAGKSTLLQALTSSTPVIAPHAFTTLNPQVGVCRILADGTILSSPSFPSPIQTPESQLSFSLPVLPTVRTPLDEPLPEKYDQTYFHGAKPRHARIDEALRFRICDNPGLVEGSHLNKGLGHQFLLSVTRTPTLVLVLDFSLPLGKLIEQAEMLVREVELFEPEQKLKERIRLVVGNKADLVSDPVRGQKRKLGLERWIRQTLGPKRTRSLPTFDEETGEETSPGGEVQFEGQEVGLKLISGMWGQGIRDLAFTMGELVVKERKVEAWDREERRRKQREEEEELIRGLQTKTGNRLLRIEAPMETKLAFGFKKEYKGLVEENRTGSGSGSGEGI
ncbi:hypothetical protein BDY24DRAFT_387177 [Mrakia frigida]|uniref:putative GTPase MTG2 n=1 Tax=Mrakia frigida TaxID=29902 RepID=UPI003FCC0B0C